MNFDGQAEAGSGAAQDKSAEDFLSAHALAATPGHYDELLDERAQLRPLWRQFAHALGIHGLQQLDDATQRVTQTVAENNITYNVFHSDAGTSRAWSLNPLPFMVSASEWQHLSRGITQRADLLNRIVADVYGEQRLLRQGKYPAHLIYGNQGYLRPLRGIEVPGNIYLHIVAFDVARGPDGQWIVVSQRTQAPSGLGYVLQNRLIMSQIFAQAIQQMPVQRLATSYRRLLETMRTLAINHGLSNEPRFALLTPGPYSETYFEQAYLARYLGLPLVEGDDLIVRDQQLFIKTLRGLEPLHGLLRRLDDDYCDPVELRADSKLGVPGLLQAIRAGKVLMANALGTGFIENPEWENCLPDLSQSLLNEDLQLNSLHALRHTDTPYLPFSQTTCWEDGKFRPKSAMLRLYAIADAHGQWQAMPGALARIATRDEHTVSMQEGGSSLDTWVMTDGMVDQYSMLNPVTSQFTLHFQRPVSSRSAEALFWMGRYTERSEWLLRLARETLNVLPNALPTADYGLGQVLDGLSRYTRLVPQPTPNIAQAPFVFWRTLIDALKQSHGNALSETLFSLQRVMQPVRDRLSAEHVRLLQALTSYHYPQHGDDILLVQQRLDHLALQLAAITGLQNDRMTRDDGWRMLTIGRLLERLIGCCDVIYAFLSQHASDSNRGFDALLALFDSTMTFRASYQRLHDMSALFDLIIAETANTRSIGFLVKSLTEEFAYLPNQDSQLQVLSNELVSKTHALIPSWSASGKYDPADLLGLKASAIRISDLISQHYFSHSTATRHY